MLRFRLFRLIPRLIILVAGRYEGLCQWHLKQAFKDAGRMREALIVYS